VYTASGDHVESLFAIPRGHRGPAGRPHIATWQDAIYLAHTETDSVAIYDESARTMLSFPTAAEDASGRLAGLFATRCGEVLTMWRAPNGGGYLYDLHALSGHAIARGLAVPDRIVGLEGPFFYSVEESGAELRLRVWKLRYPVARAVGSPEPGR
jgi:hypothetical protein